MSKEYDPILKEFYCYDREAFERLKKELDEPKENTCTLEKSIEYQKKRLETLEKLAKFEFK